MYNDLGLTFNGRPRKCAKDRGDVTGNYHPHGTLAAYEALFVWLRTGFCESL